MQSKTRGIIVCTWHDKIGTVLKAKYPLTNFTTPPELLITLYTFHTMGGMRPGFLTIKRDDLTAASYFMKLDKPKKLEGCYVALLLNPDEYPEIYKDLISSLGKELYPSLLQDAETDFTPLLSRYYLQTLNVDRDTGSNEFILPTKSLQELNRKIQELNGAINNLKALLKIPEGFLKQHLVDKYLRLEAELRILKTKLMIKDNQIKDLEDYIKSLKSESKLIQAKISKLRTERARSS
jgi:hypothetical protein